MRSRPGETWVPASRFVARQSASVDACRALLATVRATATTRGSLPARYPDRTQPVTPAEDHQCPRSQIRGSRQLSCQPGSDGDQGREVQRFRPTQHRHRKGLPVPAGGHADESHRADRPVAELRDRQTPSRRDEPASPATRSAIGSRLKLLLSPTLQGLRTARR